LPSVSSPKFLCENYDKLKIYCLIVSKKGVS
jgi:hypothetical protein